MAADPELVKAFSKIIWIVAPFLIIVAILNAISSGSKRSSRRRRGADKPLLEEALDGLLRLFTRGRRFKEQKTLEQLRRLTPTEFEKYIAELFRRVGFQTETVGGSYDGGIDVVAKKDGFTYYIQCKKFITRQVSVHDVRDFYGAIAEKLPNARGIFITTNVFTPEARRFCEGKPVELIDGASLMEYVRKAGVTAIPDSQTEKCPRDGGMLIERQGKFGTFIGCSNFPRCTYTKSY